MGMVPLRDSLWELLYSPDAPRIAGGSDQDFRRNLVISTAFIHGHENNNNNNNNNVKNALKSASAKIAIIPGGLTKNCSL
ncbi:hypothetical protein TNCV_2531951 [Trichonephila clavipes]|nr:hypothetical protein TNCV_2531951 [Trichonephila clavipes]